MLRNEQDWKADGPYIFLGNDCIGIFDTDNASKRVMAERAALAVKSVNHHDELVECVKAALNMIDGNGMPPNWDWLRATVKSAEQP